MRTKIVTMQRNKNRSGYKKTKVGWIPGDWECKPFTSIFDRVILSLVPEKAATYREIGVRSHAKGVFHKAPITGAALGSKRVFHCQPGTLVFNIVFAWEQAVALLSEQERGMIASHRFPMYKGKNGQAYELYFLSFFKTRKGKEGLSIASPGGAGRNKTLGQKEMGYLFVPKPTKPEQQAIAEVLECWDKAIRNYEKKIEKKRNIKKGLMQRLLTGKQRLRGFSGKWKKVKLGEICDILDNQRKPVNGDDRTDIQGDIPYYGANGILDYINDYIFDEELVLVAEDGGHFEEFASRPIAQLIRGRSWVNNHAHVLRAKNGENAFLFFSLVHRDILKYLNSGTRVKLNKSELISIRLDYPNQDEQQAITVILSSADLEINTLDQKVKALKDQKQFLLNNMVTGTIRLPQFARAKDHRR